MDDEHEGTLNPLSRDDEMNQDGEMERNDDTGQNDDGELDVTREQTDFTELANARAKEAMDQLENMRFASREAKRKRKEAWEKEHQGTIHLSDAVDLDPEAIKQAGQKYDQFGKPIDDPVDFGQFGQPMEGMPMNGQPMPMQPMNGQMPMNGQPMPMNGAGMVDPMMPIGGQMMAGQPMPGQPMNGQSMPMQPMNGQMNGQMNGVGGPQMVGQMGVVTNLDGTVPIASLDPTSRPMKQVPTVVVQKPKKIRKGWLVAISVSAFVAIASAVLAVLIIANNKPDTVGKAIENVAMGGLAKNIAIDGEVDFEFTNSDMTIETLEVNMEGAIKTDTLENTLNAKIVANMAAGDKLGVEANEAYVRNNGVYVKLDKAGALIKEIKKGTANTDEAAKDEDEDAEKTDEKSSETAAEKAKRETEKAWELLTNIIAKTDGKWVRLNSAEADTSALGDAKGGTCEASLANNLAGNLETIAAIYRNFPFISSTTKGVELEKAQNTVYKVNIDLNNLTSFFNGIESMKSLAAYEECKGLVQPAIVGSEVAEIFKHVSNVYVEVSEDYVITRVYFEYTADWGGMMADLYLSYPETLRIEAPEESVDLSQVIKAVAK